MDAITPNQNELLSTRQVAAIAGVTTETANEWCRVGRGGRKLPAIRAGPTGHYRVRRGDLDAWLGLSARDELVEVQEPESLRMVREMRRAKAAKERVLKRLGVARGGRA